VFLKTIIASRKVTTQYLGRKPTMKMDADEKELLESVVRGEWKSAGESVTTTPLVTGSGADHGRHRRRPRGDRPRRASRIFSTAVLSL
jgi:hypothetical protein